MKILPIDPGIQRDRGAIDAEPGETTADVFFSLNAGRADFSKRLVVVARTVEEARAELEALTGEREMDATAMLDYFGPLNQWLDEQNEGRTCGW